jgi:hypothetical protein
MSTGEVYILTPAVRSGSPRSSFPSSLPPLSSTGRVQSLSFTLPRFSGAVRSGFETAMTTPKHNNHGGNSPGHRPRPLEIVLNGPNGDREPKLLLVSLYLLTSPDADSHLTVTADRTGFPLTTAHSAVRSTLYACPHIPHSPTSKSPQFTPRTSRAFTLVSKLPTA